VSEGYEVAHIDDLEALPVDEEGLTWRPIRRRFDIRAFGINAYTAERGGQRVVEEHAEAENHEELYVIVQGRATFTLDEEEVDAPAGTLVFVRDAAVERVAFAKAESTVVLSIGAAAEGQAFTPAGWDTSYLEGS
jgi:uncharacterized cupin superfamily protein